MDLRLFATVPKGMESLLAGELLGWVGDVRQARAGVVFSGELRPRIASACVSRLAQPYPRAARRRAVNDGDELHATAQCMAWDEHLAVSGTLAVDFTGTNAAIRDTRFGAVRVKDAIVDQFRERHADRRPSVDARAPDMRVNAHLARGRVTLSLDLSGESLHRRGYRADKVQVQAPLKENLAAAVLLFAEWPRLTAGGGSFLDPLCGSGTLPIEAALIAADVAPGLLRAARRDGFGFARWLGHDAGLWGEMVVEARERRAAGLNRLAAAGPGLIRGADRDERALRVARACAERAGLRDVVTFERADLSALAAPAHRGLLAANPPYGERLREPETARSGTRRSASACGPALTAGVPPSWRATRGSSPRSAWSSSARRPCTTAPCRCSLPSSRSARRPPTPRPPGATRRARLAMGPATRPPRQLPPTGVSARSTPPACSRRRGAVRQPAAQEPTAAGAAAAARGAHLLSRVRRRPA